MPTLNRKLLLRLFLVTLILGVGLFLVHYVQSDRATDALRQQAERAAENGRVDKAISYMKRYLDLRPTDHDAAVALADMILKRGSSRRDFSNVLFLYERVLREAPERSEIRRKLVDICLRLDRYGDATIHARALLDFSPRDGELWEKLAVAQSSQNKHDDARSSYIKALECDPGRIRSYELLAELLIRQLQQPDEGREWIQKMVQANPASGEARLVRARYYRSQNKLADCLRDLDRLMEIDPENADGLLIQAELLQGKDQVAAARQILSDGIALYQKDVRFYRVLSWLELSSGNVPAAVACLEQGIKQLPNATELLTPLGDLLVQQGDVDRVRGILQKLDGRRGVDSQMKYLRARMLMQESKWSEAIALLEVLRNQEVTMPGLTAQVNLLLATCHERLADRNGQLEALKRALAIDAGHLGARLKFGALRLAAGELDEAVKEYTVAARSPFAPLGTRVLLGRLMIARARAGAGTADWNTIADYVAILRDKYKNTVDPVLLAAEMHMARQQYDAARKLLREESGKKVNDGRIWSVLAAIAQETEGTLAALDVISEAQALIGDQVELRLAQARVWAADPAPGAAERIRNLGAHLERFSETDQFRFILGMTELCSCMGDWNGLKQYQRLLAERLPRDMLIRRSLYDSALRTNDEPLRAALRQELQSLKQESVVAVADALARLERSPADPKELLEFQALARQTIDAAPERGDAHLLAAKTSDAATAAAKFVAARALEPDNLTFMEAQLVHLIRHGEPAAAKQRLEQLYFDPRMSGEAFLGLVSSVSRQLSIEQHARCLSLVEPLVKKSGVSLLWLARVERAKGRLDEARALATKATVLAPTLVDAWVTLARLQPEHARDVLAKARGALNERAWHVFCAEIRDALQVQQAGWRPDFTKATEQRLYALACLKSFLLRQQAAEAVQFLTRMVEEPTARPKDVAWAKQNLALVSATRGKALDRAQATALVRDLQDDASGGPEELRSRTIMLIRALGQVSGTARRAVGQQAIDSMKRVTADSAATAKDWFQLAQLHRMMADRASYETCLKEAMRREPENLFYVVACADELLAENRLDEVEAHLPRLLQAINDRQAASVICRYFALANLPNRAVESANTFAQAADPGTFNGPASIRQAAEMLDQSARLAAAAKRSGSKMLVTAALEKYRVSMSPFPDTVGLMALLLAFHGRIQDALDLLAAKKPTINVVSWLTTAMSILEGGGATPRQYQIVRGWIEAALLETPQANALKLCLAKFHALRQDFAAAEPIYRDVLTNEPTNVVALNDLAWILAPRAEALDESLRCIEKAIELAGASGELLDTRARILIARGNFDRAIEDLNQALEMGQTSLRHFHLAIAQFKQFKKVEAMQSFRQARNRGLDPKMIHPTDMPTYKVLAAQLGEQ